MAAPDFEHDLVGAISHLRAFARSFANDPARADDLVQETLVKAWNSRDSFTPGTNFRAWLFTILRNVYFSQHRKLRREVDDPDEQYQNSLSVPPEQHGHLDLADFRTALGTLPSDQREALVLVGAEGFSYEEAAEICGCAVGTIKSRVNRARNRLVEILGDPDLKGGQGSSGGHVADKLVKDAVRG
ncbi:sigma-70 family RNA polymerase sigma factor [Hyphomicrobium sp.]|uniref:sigma-70 family RNA polymerase sigma factor n=1 Tax=Hyphomicrobium sp. TaxID=82 RepID=UPI002B94C30F|nr:sigma-70 family RNA polymerase sigma factor [Hyphomicrobium sp.]HRN89971.1 sigma-70 family RNA polymerase sigma factor [Hyphomicrobium sp.]HRQ26202.1 sigma-70 family RNA polymerase sigma factor [Hyphomicrobium sp.]